MEENSGCTFEAESTIGGLRINKASLCCFGSIETESANVWLKYIPQHVENIKPAEVDIKSDQLMPPYTCRVAFSRFGGGKGVLFNSCGVHLAHIRMPDNGDEDVNGKDLEDECCCDGNNEDDLNEELHRCHAGYDLHQNDDGVGDEVRPSKRRKKM